MSQLSLQLKHAFMQWRVRLHPAQCRRCYAPAPDFFCEPCQVALGFRANSLVYRVGPQLASYAVAQFNPTLKEWLYDWKFSPPYRWSRAHLDWLLLDVLLSAPAFAAQSYDAQTYDAIVLAPASAQRRHRASLPVVGRLLSWHTGWPVVPQALFWKNKNRTPQHQCADRLARFRNVQDSVGVNANAFARLAEPPQRVLVLDDLLTTGATMQACAAALQHTWPGLSLNTWAIAHVPLES